MKSSWAVILGGSIIIAAVVFGIFYYGANMRTETVRVVGYATRDFDADVAKWSFTLSESAPLNDLAGGFRRIEKQAAAFRKVWDAQGVVAEELTFQPVSTGKNYDRNGEESGYRVTQQVDIVCRDLDGLDALAQNPMAFIDAGVAFEYSRIEYYSSDIADLKKELLANATADARDRAERIVEGGGRAIAKLMSARSGIFQITERLSTEVSDYGMYNTASRHKTIKVTVSAEFGLE